jgi:hypothetical protein
MPETVSKSKLKAKMLEVFRELEASREELVVSHHGEPVLKDIPIKRKDQWKKDLVMFKGA